MISELFAKYRFGAMHTTDIADGKVTNLACIPPNLRYSTNTCPEECGKFVFLSKVQALVIALTEGN